MSFNPNQPRDSHGRFGEIANAIGNVARAAEVAAQALAFPKHGPHIDPNAFRRITTNFAEEAKTIGERSMPGFIPGVWDKLAVSTYTGSERLNKLLRSGADPSDFRVFGQGHYLIQDLDKLIGQSRLPENLKLYRGISNDRTGFARKLVPGYVFQDKGFVSTSIDKEVARQYSTRLGTRKEGALVHVYAPKGKSALSLNPFAFNFGNEPVGEYEMLLPRNSKFRVLGREANHVYAELL